MLMRKTDLYYMQYDERMKHKFIKIQSMAKQLSQVQKQADTKMERMYKQTLCQKEANGKIERIHKQTFCCSVCVQTREQINRQNMSRIKKQLNKFHKQADTKIKRMYKQFYCVCRQGNRQTDGTCQELRVREKC